MINPAINSLIPPAKQLIIFLHGVGSDGNDLLSLVPYIQDQLPHYYFLSPHGVEPYDMAPYGRQWFSLKNRDTNILVELMNEAIPKLQKIISDKQVELNLTNADTILVGFSQGTMMSLYLNLTTDIPFKAVVGFSGALIAPKRIINKKTPICLIHGIEDEVININALHIAEESLLSQNIQVETHKIKNLKHSIDDKALQTAINFIMRQENE